MENRDILRQICSRLDNETLIAFTDNLRLWREVTALLKDNTFWHERSEFLVGRTLHTENRYDWRTIYDLLLWTIDSLVEFEKLHDPNNGVLDPYYSAGLISNVDVLLVLFEVYGTPIKPSPRQRTLEYCGWITRPAVLQYLLDEGFLIYDQEIVRAHISKASEKNGGEIILPYLLSMLKENTPLDSAPLFKAAREGRAKIVEVLLPRTHLEPWRGIDEVLKSAASGKSGAVISYLVNAHTHSLILHWLELPAMLLPLTTSKD